METVIGSTRLGAPARSAASRQITVGALLVATAGCEVVREVGRDTVQVQVVDTVTVVRTDTVRIRDSLSAWGDEIAASALAALRSDSALLPTVPAGTGDPVAVAPLPSNPPVAPVAPVAPLPVITNADLTTLHARRLIVPVAGVRVAGLSDTFTEMRGSRRHEALDILAPRGTAVLSVDAGRVFRLYTSDAGGLTLYAGDPTGQFMYYYAHLDRYHPRMREGVALARGDTIGFVGTTGNAAPSVPHLHFALARVADPRQWWKGTPVNPFTLLVDGP